MVCGTIQVKLSSALNLYFVLCALCFVPGVGMAKALSTQAAVKSRQ